MSQFAFLKPEFTPVYEHAQRAEVLALSDPRGSCFYTRLALETAVKWLYQHDGTLRSPYDDALSALIHEGSFRTLVGNALVTKARLIKDFGNSAVHDSRAVSENTATVALRALFHFSYWLAHTYAKGAKPAAGVQFAAEALPKTQLVEAKTLADLQAIADGFEKQTKAQEAAEAARIQTQQERDTLDAEIKRLRLEVAATKKANQLIPDDHDYNEAQTRDAFIDLLLREAGWPLDQARDREFRVTGMPNTTGEGFVDYILWGADGRPLAIIETKKNGTRRFGAGHFDLIVIDEAHRSVYRKYRAIFDYFDSYLVGLTATPRDEVDRDTYSLFELERGVPTDAYDLSEAVADGFLVPAQAVSVPLKFQREGIRYDDLSDGEKEQWDALEWSEDGNVPDRVDASALNKWLFNTDTVDKVLAHVMTHGLKVENGDRLGKTIIFAKNHAHAAFISERFDANWPHLKGHFARVIDHQTEYAQSLIDAFSTKDKAPHIAISVDMLDTGIDVPDLHRTRSSSSTWSWTT